MTKVFVGRGGVEGMYDSVQSFPYPFLYRYSTDLDQSTAHGKQPTAQTSYFKNRSLDLTLSDYPAGNPEYVQATSAGQIPFGFWILKSD